MLSTTIFDHAISVLQQKQEQLLFRVVQCKCSGVPLLFDSSGAQQSPLMMCVGEGKFKVQQVAHSEMHTVALCYYFHTVLVTCYISSLVFHISHQ